MSEAQPLKNLTKGVLGRKKIISKLSACLLFEYWVDVNLEGTVLLGCIWGQFNQNHPSKVKLHAWLYGCLLMQKKNSARKFWVNYPWLQTAKHGKTSKITLRRVIGEKVHLQVFLREEQYHFVILYRTKFIP